MKKRPENHVESPPKTPAVVHNFVVNTIGPALGHHLVKDSIRDPVLGKPLQF